MSLFKNLLNTTFKKATLITIIFMIITISAFVFYIVPYINDVLINEKKKSIYEMSYFLIEMLQEIKTQEDAGTLSRDEAQSMAKEIVNNFRYGENHDDYFWINRFEDGIIIVHPSEELIGVSIETLMDADEYAFGKTMLKIARENGEGYVSYKWVSKVDPANRNVPKLSYVTQFKPWGWMLGTGIYLDDVQKEISVITWQILGVIFLIFALLIGLLAFVLHVGARIERHRNIIQSEFVSLTQHLPIGVFRICISEDEPPSLWNKALLELLEIPSEKHLQQKDFNLASFIKNKDDEEKLRKILEKHDRIIGEEIEVKTFTNKTLWVKLYGKLIERDHKMYFDASIENVTEKRKVDEVMQKSYRELQRIDQMKDEIISITSHELRTPLTIIKGFASILSSEIFGTLTTKQKNYTEKIIRNTNKLLEMTKNMLDLEKLRTGALHFDIKNVKINDLIEQSRDDFETRCTIEHKKCLFHLDTSNPVIETDPVQFKRIITNLVDNALKFTKPHVGKIEIFTKKLNSDKIEIHIKDNGVGIAKKDLADVFKKFKQVGGHMRRISGGSGLGLPIAKSLAEGLGGTLNVHSAPDKGSDFYITLNIKNNL